MMPERRTKLPAVCMAACILPFLACCSFFLATGPAAYKRIFLDEPLIVAALQGDLAEVKRLVAAGADPNCSEEHDGYTPLMCALTNHNDDVAAYLIKAGADVRLRSSNGTTAIVLAADRPRLVRMILNKGGRWPGH